MPAQTDIINFALTKIGGSVITDLDDGSKNANVAGQLYDEVRDDLLRSHPWNFATRRANLAPLVTAPTFEFDNAYSVPADWLRTISVHDNDGGFGIVHYRLEQVADARVIVANAEDVYLRYIARVTDPNLMPPDFRVTLATALAMEMALPIGSSSTMREAMERQFRSVLMKAKSVDGQGSSPEHRPRGSWATARGGISHRVWPQ